jgi:hypothetical protein
MAVLLLPGFSTLRPGDINMNIQKSQNTKNELSIKNSFKFKALYNANI